jgi:hypothetical protein
VDDTNEQNCGVDVDVNQIMDNLRELLTGNVTQPIPPSIRTLARGLTVCHVPQQQIFTVSSADGVVHAVHLFPRESCTCPAAKRCCHIIAAMNSIGMSVDERKVTHLSVLCRNSRFVLFKVLCAVRR